MVLGLALVVALWTAAAPGPDLSSASDVDLAGALAALRKISAGVTPADPRASPTAARLEEIGRAYLDRGKTGQARELLEEAFALDEQNGLVLAELTLAYVRAEDFPFARFYLELAQERAVAAPPAAYAALGEAYYALNRLDDAVLAWEQFRRLGGSDPRVLRRLERARQELSLSSNQRYFETEDFVFYFDAAVPREMVERIATRLAEAYREQGDFLGVRLPGPQVVLLYAGRAYFALVSVPEWVSGVFDGKIRVSVDPDGGFTPQLAAVLSHELAHALIRAASKDRAPGWIHEGLAQWWEGKRVQRNEFRQVFRGSPPHSLSSMEGNLAVKADRAAARSNYVEALGLIEYLMQSHGPGSVACIVRDLGGGLSAEEALVTETGISPAALVAQWKAWAGI